MRPNHPEREQVACSSADVASLIAENKGLIYFVIHKYRNRAAALRVSEDELYSEGLYGLYRAAQKYDPSRGAAFATYAVAVIRGTIRNYFRDHSRLIRIPRRYQESNRPQDYELKMVFFGDSGSAESEQGSESKVIENYISEHADFSIAVVHDFVHRLPQACREVLRLRYLYGMSQREIGSALGIGQMTVSRRLLQIQGLYQEYAAAN